MPKDIGRDDVRRMIDQAAQIVEVLPEHEYEHEHLPGAINMPLKKLSARTVGQLHKDRAVVVYCWDYQ